MVSSTRFSASNTSMYKHYQMCYSTSTTYKMHIFCNLSNSHQQIHHLELNRWFCRTIYCCWDIRPLTAEPLCYFDVIRRQAQVLQLVKCLRGQSSTSEKVLWVILSTSTNLLLWLAYKIIINLPVFSKHICSTASQWHVWHSHCYNISVLSPLIISLTGRECLSMPHSHSIS